MVVYFMFYTLSLNKKFGSNELSEDVYYGNSLFRGTFSSL